MEIMFRPHPTRVHAILSRTPLHGGISAGMDADASSSSLIEFIDSRTSIVTSSLDAVLTLQYWHY